MDTEQLLQTIAANLETAQKHLDDIHQEIEHLAVIGMYPSLPTEQWQNRGGAGQYLYMLFRQDRNGQYTGPDGKRKLYVGADPVKIAEARRLAKNRRRYEELCEAARQVEQWLKSQEYQIERLAKDSGRWPHMNCVGDWGQAATQLVVAANPNSPNSPFGSLVGACLRPS